MLFTCSKHLTVKYCLNFKLNNFILKKAPMSQGFKNVYMSPESEMVDKELITLKEKILHFERIKDAGRIVDNIRGSGTIKSKEINYNKDSERNVNEVKSKSRIELLKEQLFERKNEEFRDEKKMKEIERICRLGIKDKMNKIIYSGEEIDSEMESNEIDVCKSITSISQDKVEFNYTIKELENKKEDNNINIKETINQLNNNFINKNEINDNFINNSKNNEDIINDIISGDVDSLSFFNLDEFNSKLNTRIDEETQKNIELEKNEYISEKNNQENLEKYKNIEIIEKCPKRIFESSVSEDKLPNTFEILNDFSKCDLRPRLFACPELKPIDSFMSMNMFIKSINREFSSVVNKNTISIPIFSKEHCQQSSVIFRAPGQILLSRPKIEFSWSVVSEEGVLIYLRVFNNTSSWHILKTALEFKKYNSEIELMAQFDTMNDNNFTKFILSDIVTTIYHRTSYVFYNDSIVLLKFLGMSLCICINKTCIKMIPLDKQKTEIYKIDTNMGPGFSVCNIVFGCSCVKERDEWYNTITTIWS